MLSRVVLLMPSGVLAQLPDAPMPSRQCEADPDGDDRG